MKKYQKKPIIIEAVQWNEDNISEIREFMGENEPRVAVAGQLAIITLDGLMYASKGDFIIKGVQGEFYPCKPDIFKQTYDPI